MAQPNGAQIIAAHKKFFYSELGRLNELEEISKIHNENGGLDPSRLAIRVKLRQVIAIAEAYELNQCTEQAAIDQISLTYEEILPML